MLGELLGDDFLIQEKLGEGGMGAVYLAQQVSMERPVVVKTLHRQLTEHESGLVRFQREARLLSRIHHPNVITVHAFGEAEDGSPFLVMELVEGQSLAQLITTQGALDTPRALDIMSQILAALTEAHSHDILHRDLKPDNIMLAQTADGVERVKLLDFGIAKLLTPEAQGLTQEGALVGTPQYMAPEQIQGGVPLDGRCDLYAAGLILFEMLTGHTPLDAETPMQALFANLSEEVPPLSEHLDLASLPQGLDLQDLVARAVAKDRDARFPNAKAMLEALQGLGSDSSRMRLPPAPGEVPPTLDGRTSHFDDVLSATALEPSTPVPPSSSPAAPRELQPWLIGGGLAALAVVIVLWLTTGAKEAPAPAPEPTREAATPDTSPEDLALDTAVAASSEPIPAPRIEVAPKVVPEPVLKPSSRLAVVAIALAESTSYALMEDGTVRAWGRNTGHALGTLELDNSATPVHISGLEGVRALTLGSGLTPNQITVCASLENAENWCWGDAQLLPMYPWDDIDQPRVFPLLTGAEQIAMRNKFGAMVKDGQLYTWGIASPGKHVYKPSAPHAAVPRLRSDLPRLESLKLARDFACFLPLEGPGMRCWGNNYNGFLTGVSQVDPNPPMRVEDPVTIELAAGDISALAVGINTLCALLEEGQLYCWDTIRREPTPMSLDVVAVSARNLHQCLVRRDGGVWCWGRDISGELGQGKVSRTHLLTPQPVKGLEGLKALDVSVGSQHSCALVEGGEVWCWGNNADGQLGDGTLADRTQAVRVEHLNDLELPPPNNAHAWYAEQLDAQTQPPEEPPEGCTLSPLAVALESRRPGTLRPRYFRAKSTTPTRGSRRRSLVIADYPVVRPADGRSLPPRGKAQLLQMTFHQLPTEGEVPAMGRYALPRDRGSKEPWIRLSIQNNTLSQPRGISDSHMDKGSFIEVTHNDGTWICGTLHVEGDFGHLRGAFSVRTETP